jgi:SAM-dependent methyltransferase
LSKVLEHYENLLAERYTWMAGGMESKIAESQAFFEAQGLTPKGNRLAVDLGSGPGFQSIALARLGYKVTAIDSSLKLLSELRAHAGELNIKTAEDDLLNFQEHLTDPAELIVCMGDTLTHLGSKEDVRRLFTATYSSLVPGGHLIITFRDLSAELKGVDRFIPVRSDEDRIFTCFLEYEPEHVQVHDLVYERNGGEWSLQKSFYQKLRLSYNWVREALELEGFEIFQGTSERGVVTFVCQK